MISWKSIGPFAPLRYIWSDDTSTLKVWAPGLSCSNRGPERPPWGAGTNRPVTPGRERPLLSARRTYTPAFCTEIGRLRVYASASPSPSKSRFSEVTGPEIVTADGWSWNVRQSYAGVAWDHWYTRPTMSAEAGRSKRLSLCSRMNVSRTAYGPLTWAFRISGAQNPIPKTSAPRSISTRPEVVVIAAPVAGFARTPTTV